MLIDQYLDRGHGLSLPEEAATAFAFKLNVTFTCLFAWADVFKHSSPLTWAIVVPVLLLFLEEGFDYAFLKVAERVVPQAGKFLNSLSQLYFPVA
jgi:hypothetical protein